MSVARVFARVALALGFADEGGTLELRALTVGQHYWFAIESFDERGVSKRSDAIGRR